MNESELVNIWNQQRAIRVKAQLAPTLLLSVVLALAATGNINADTDTTLKLFVFGLVASGGVFSVTAMLAATRDSLAVIDSLKGLKTITPLAKTIQSSAGMLKLIGVLFIIMSTFNVIILLNYLTF